MRQFKPFWIQCRASPFGVDCFSGTAPPPAKRRRFAAPCNEVADSDTDSCECVNSAQDDQPCYYEGSWKGHGQPLKWIWMTAKSAHPKLRVVCMDCYLRLQSTDIGFTVIE